ncbi:MAG TPA: molybdate ABC transporter substrate-binding protein [Holophagaceae bacterium]|nr:molybdate ABC transporter substrate-binding protein [Holophagaceae bacterium]
MKVRAALLLLLALPMAAQTRTLRVAAAADLRGALEKVQAAYQQRHPDTRIESTFGASGSLVAQIRQGAPFDVLLAADLDFPRRLEREGLVLDETFPYAEGRLALWVDRTLGLDPAQAGLPLLMDRRVRRVAIANPEVAPYGRAAMAALEQAHLNIQDKLLRAENVAQAAQYLQAGAAEAGLISATQARHPALRDRGRVWLLPPGSHPPLKQGGALLKRSGDPATCRSFRDFLLGPEGRAILAQEGFGAP